jgi:hypothetical protein
MWAIASLINPNAQPVSMSDGQPISAVRGPAGASFRMIAAGLGFLDFTDTGPQPGGPHGSQIVINGQIYWYDGQGALTVTLNADSTFQVTGDGNNISGSLSPLPMVFDGDAGLLDLMMSLKLVPYQNIPGGPGKTDAEIQALGLQYFPFTPYSYELAMSVYDWTTASFARFVFFKVFAYTYLQEQPLDLASIANAIWSSDYPPYEPSNVNYMESFLMAPATSDEEVYTQLLNVYQELQAYNDAENRLAAAAFQSLPRTSVLAKPHLFSGQVDISNLGPEHFAPELLQFPGNAGPTTVPLQMPLAQALATFITVGSTISTKMVWSFTDSITDAMHYQNGILLIANPPAGAVVWHAANYITPLSDSAEKIEYTFAPRTRFLIQDVSTQTIEGKTVTVITLQLQS